MDIQKKAWKTSTMQIAYLAAQTSLTIAIARQSKPSKGQKHLSWSP